MMLYDKDMTYKANKPRGRQKNPRPKTMDKYFRVQITMPRQLNDWMEDLGSEAKELGGFKLSKTQIVRSLIDALQQVEDKLDLTNVRDEEVLTERILDAFHRGLKKKK